MSTNLELITATLVELQLSDRYGCARSLVNRVARSRQVYIEWLWKHCLLLSSYLRNEQILIDIGNVTVRSSSLSRHSASPIQLNLSRRRRYHLYLLDKRRLPGWHQTRPIRNNLFTTLDKIAAFLFPNRLASSCSSLFYEQNVEITEIVYASMRLPVFASADSHAFSARLYHADQIVQLLTLFVPRTSARAVDS